MKNKFDELTKSLAQSTTRRAALKKIGLGLAGMALACFGLANKVEANSKLKYCKVDSDCRKGLVCDGGQCLTPCNSPADCQSSHSTGTCCWPSNYGHAGYAGVCNRCY
jgi:hypothetical protein